MKCQKCGKDAVGMVSIKESVSVPANWVKMWGFRCNDHLNLER